MFKVKFDAFWKANINQVGERIMYYLYFQDLKHLSNSSNLSNYLNFAIREGVSKKTLDNMLIAADSANSVSR